MIEPGRMRIKGKTVYLDGRKLGTIVKTQDDGKITVKVKTSKDFKKMKSMLVGVK
jgi:hypothetical protein